jgi:hypothetical protein
VECLKRDLQSGKQKAGKIDDIYYRSQYIDAPALHAAGMKPHTHTNFCMSTKYRNLICIIEMTMEWEI